MKRATGAVVALLLAAATATADDVSKLYTSPSVPPREALERLNLKLGWRTYVPMDGRRDGLLSVQRDGDVLFVQTRSGLVVALDPETGTALWRARVGKPYTPHHPLGFSSYYVFALRETSLHVLNRRSGQEVWEVPLPNGPGTGPAADDRQVAVTVAGGRVYFYAVPKPEDAVLKPGQRPEPKKLDAAPPGGGNPPDLPYSMP